MPFSDFRELKGRNINITGITFFPLNSGHPLLRLVRNHKYSFNSLFHFFIYCCTLPQNHKTFIFLNITKRKKNDTNTHT